MIYDEIYDFFVWNNVIKMHICDANKVYYVQQDLNFSNEVFIYHQMSENKVLESFWKLEFLSLHLSYE